MFGPVLNAHKNVLFGLDGLEAHLWGVYHLEACFQEWFGDGVV